MMTKRIMDRVGGIGSIPVGVFCAFMGYRDWQIGHSLWKVWVVLFVVLVINGIAMIRYSLRKEPDRIDDRPGTHAGIVSGSSRI